MSRPIKCRRIYQEPSNLLFKPAGIPRGDLEVVQLSLDEVEALRLADLLGLYQEEAAAQMLVSRQTFGNILAMARKKTAECIIQGKALYITGGFLEKGENEESFDSLKYCKKRRCCRRKEDL